MYSPFLLLSSTAIFGHLTDMEDEKKTCPNCGQPLMEPVGEGHLRVCVNCKALAWEENGRTEWQVPEKLTPDEIAALKRGNDEPVRPKHRRRRVM